jgi:pyruvate dehydrogenase (quinone)
MTTVAEHIVSALAAAGVRRIYGVVGDSLNSIVDAVHRSKDIKWIHVRHEEVGAFAASAEAQLTGNLAVCAGSCGPGNLHLINGLYDAHKAHAPVLAIASQIPSSEIGTDYFQETHPERLFVECSHFCQLVSTEKQMPRLLQIAVQTAISRGGVSVLVIPGDVATQKITSEALEHSVFRTRPVVQPCESDLQKLADMLNGARRLTLFCGAGCADAHDQVLRLAKLLKAPIAYSFRGKEHIEHDNPFAVGMTGLLGVESAHYAMEKADVLLMLGTDFPYVAWYPKKAKIVQIDVLAEHLGRRSKLDLGLVGDTKTTIEALLPHLNPKKDESHLKACLEKHRDTRNSLAKLAHGKKGDRPIRPEYLTAMLSDAADKDAIFTVDTGMSNVWAARYLEMPENRRLIGSFNHGSMANAMPQAIGAQLAYPKRQVISLCGDGGFTMLLGDLLTIAQYDLPVKLIVYNNSSLGMVKLEMRVAGYGDFGVDMKNPDFAKLAEAVGIRGFRVEDPADIRSALETALRHRGPALVDAVTNPNELAMPPKVDAKEAAGYGLYLAKQTLHGRLFESLDELKGNLP